MTTFIPGKTIKTFITKKGNKTIIRYPKWEDLDQMLQFINHLSQEDTFISYSGEKITTIHPRPRMRYSKNTI